MTILTSIASVFSAKTLSYADDDLIEQPPFSGSLFYDIMEMPEGPGVAQLKKVLAYLPPLDIKKGPWLAGGACRRILQGKSLEGGDIDIFFQSRQSRKDFDEALERFEVLHRSSMATSYKVGDMTVQTIKREHYLKLEDVFRDFDFSACQIASDGRWLAATPQAARDIKSHTLRFAPQGRVSKITVISRMAKYLNHGFLPEPGLFKIMVEAGIQTHAPYMWPAEVSDHNEHVYDHCLDAEDALWTKDVDAEALEKIRLSYEEKYGAKA